MTNKETILENVQDNIARVRNIKQLYDKKFPAKEKSPLKKSAAGRKETSDSDILRAAIVLLHACTEDFFRDIAKWKLPLAQRGALVGIPIAGSEGRAPKFSLGDLSKFRGDTVDKVIQDSVREHMEMKTYNNVSDVKLLLTSIGMDPESIDKYEDKLGAMMDRRHHIVHRADKNEATGTGQHNTKSISSKLVESWIKNVEEMVKKVSDDL